MTRTPAILGAEYDAPAQLAANLYVDGAKRGLIHAALQRAEEAADAESAQLMLWELAMLNLLPMTRNETSPWQAGPWEQFAEIYRLTPETVAYALDRARETGDLRLKVRYLEFALRRSEQTGRSWIELQRELLGTYREYAEACRAAIANAPHGHGGIYIQDALTRIGQLLSVRGVVTPADAPLWAEWIVGLAEDSRSFSADDAGAHEQQRHRWVFDYLRILTSLPAEAINEALRVRALRLLADAAVYYEKFPLLHYFDQAIAEIEYELQKSWGEPHAHERMIRRQFEATMRCAGFHRSHGNDLVAAEFFGQARALAAKYRPYFTDAEVTRLGRAEQEALIAGEDEFTRLTFSIEVPGALMDYVCATSEETVQAIVAEAATAVPSRARLHKDVLEANQQAPLQAIIGRTMVAPGKVVGRTGGEAGNVAVEIQSRAMLQTQLLADGIATAVQKAAGQIGLTPEHLVAPLASLALDEGSLQLIRHGLARLIAGDPTSATHILIPRVEDALRQHLKTVGFSTTDFIADIGDGTSRTDDATLGSLLYKKLPDGRTVRDYLGEDLWEHVNAVLNRQTGPNLRNEFAHGLARPAHCTPANAAIALMLLYQLAGVASRSWLA